MSARLNIILFFLSIALCACAQTYPGIVLTKAGVEKIKSEPHPSLFQDVFNAAIADVDNAIEKGIDVPTPKDMAGGYTHETHKRNYRVMHTAGSLYQISGKEKYAAYIKKMLLAYATMYPSLPIHPTDRSYATGKLFWQCLNDANWMVYTSQAYDAIYEYLSKQEREKIEGQLLRPCADFLSIENPQFFNRVHNHSTWGNAAVGMIGLVMDDDELIQRALYGLQLDQKDDLAKDNDGGFIYEKGKAEAGFFAQLDYAFSPDGYYTEGPYYQRYAMLPFMLFAQALHNKKPELKIFEYRDGLLTKAVEALVIQTNDAGEFFPINDAQKGMSIKAESVVTAVNIAYGVKKSPALLAAARIQGSVLLDQNGFEIARDLANNRTTTLAKKSIMLRDGKEGDEGAFILLRAGGSTSQITVGFKCTSQGLGHGHYDKLSLCMYDGNTELLQDFGAARWVNIDQKAGGRYLPENKTWAKQTVAHNTVAVDQTSHFNGVYEVANTHHSEPLFFNVSNEHVQVAGAQEINAYDDVDLHRILILWTDAYFEKPLLIDIYSMYADNAHTYDLPFHHAAQIMDASFGYETCQPEIMGDAHGYQHLYKEAAVTCDSVFMQVNLMKDNLFFTLSGVTSVGDKLLLARAGANDPHFNIRRDPLLIHRKENAKNATFLSVVESHGHYSPVSEVPIKPYTGIASLEIINDSKNSIDFMITSVENNQWVFAVDKSTGVVQINSK